MEAVKEVTLGNKTLKIFHSEYTESPREWDNLARMIFAGKWRSLGDKHDIDFGGFNSRDEFIELGEKELRQQIKDVVICKAVHLYSHSGETISTSDEYPYNDRWDSGTIGFAIVTKDDIRKNYNVKKVTAKHIEQAERILDGEVETLDTYIRGEVYSFQLFEDGEQIDSCGGFFGDDFKTNGILDHAGKEFEELV